jgi:UDP-GlcNAc:undecaprenyl-phosphate GlcNAc-1-phosphate transferase
MKTAALMFALAAVCAALLTPLVRRLAYRWGVLDHALAARKIHGRPVPRLGGLAIIVAFYVPLLVLIALPSAVGAAFFADIQLVACMFAGGIVVVLLGVYDDVRGADAYTKLLVQLAVSLLVYAGGVRVEEIGNPFGGPIQLGWLSLPVTVVWIVGVVNAMNLVDGLDGLAGGVALVALSTIFVVAVAHEQALMMLFCATLGGAVLGFLFYNFNPASIFMGDTGSMFLGYILAVSSVKTGYKSSTAITVVSVVLAFPILDTVLALVRRAASGRPLFHGDNEHIHHRLLALGLSHRKAVLALYGASVVMGLVTLALEFFDSSWLAVLAMTAFAGLLAIVLSRLGYVGGGRELAQQRRKNRRLRSAVRPVATRLRSVGNVDELWDAIRTGSRVFDASFVRLELAEQTRKSSDAAPDRLFCARFTLPRRGFVDLGWADGRSALDRDTEIAIERFCDQIGAACERVHSS